MEKISRGMVKLIQADNFFQPGGAQELYSIVSNLQFVEKEYGKEIDNFNLIQPGLEPLFSRAIGEPVVIDEDNSGVFRFCNSTIHFESFDHPDEWCFAIALEDHIMFNTYHHNSGAETVFDGYKFHYRNLFEWKYISNFELKANQGIFYRPWIFHSFGAGLIQYYKLLPLNKDSEPTENG